MIVHIRSQHKLPSSFSCDICGREFPGTVAGRNGRNVHFGQCRKKNNSAQKRPRLIHVDGSGTEFMQRPDESDSSVGDDSSLQPGVIDVPDESESDSDPKPPMSGYVSAHIK